MKKTIEMKIAKNGVKLYYVDGKRTSREVALQAAADNRENLFTIEYPIPRDPYFTGRILIAGANVYESTSKAVLKELELKIDEYHGFTVQLHTIGWVEICKLFNKDYAKSLINKIENAFIRGEYGVKIDKYGKVSILPAPVIEPNPDDYAVNPDAFDEAVNAEIQNANNVKINDLKWEIRYTEGSIDDLDKNHIAHFPNDQSLKERRAELVNELAALKAQLAEIEPANTHEADHITGIKEDNVGNHTDSAQPVWCTKGELDDLTAKFRDAVSIIPVTTRIEKMLPVTITITKQNRTKPFDMGFGAFAKYSIVQWRTGLRIMRNFSTLGIYDTPAQVEKVIDLLKAAITRGDKEFTFPTVEELIDPPELPTAKPRTLRDSINRAIKQCIRNRVGYLKSHNSKMEKYEYELLCLLQGARRELEVA